MCSHDYAVGLEMPPIGRTQNAEMRSPPKVRALIDGRARTVQSCRQTAGISLAFAIALGTASGCGSGDSSRSRPPPRKPTPETSSAIHSTGRLYPAKKGGLIGYVDA